MKKSLFIGAAAAALFTAPAMAAGLPVKAPPKVPTVVAPPAYNWTGWYVGGNVGYGWGENTGDLWDSYTGNFGPVYFAAGGNGLPGVKPNGIVGGGQVGYNWQVAPNWVWGLVADIQGSDMHGSASVSVTPPGFGSTIQSNSSKIDWLGTVRGRVGYAANNWLFYATGGLAYGNVNSTLTLNCTTVCNPSVVWSGSKSATQIGWAAGAGIEVGLTPRWTAGVEYLHFDLGSISTTTRPNFAGDVTFTADSAFAGDIVRGMVNYKF